jgi:hypothetical protein
MCKTSRETIELLHKRASRLVQWLAMEMEGDVPHKLMDDELRMVEDAIRQYRAERDAGSN